MPSSHVEKYDILGGKLTLDLKIVSMPSKERNVASRAKSESIKIASRIFFRINSYLDFIMKTSLILTLAFSASVLAGKRFIQSPTILSNTDWIPLEVVDHRMMDFEKTAPRKARKVMNNEKMFHSIEVEDSFLAPTALVSTLLVSNLRSNWEENESMFIQNWETESYWVQTESQLNSKLSKTEPKIGKIEPHMNSKMSQNRAKMGRKWGRIESKLSQNWVTNEFKN